MSELKDKLPTLESLKLVNDTLSVKIEKNTQNISQLTEENAELKGDLGNLESKTNMSFLTGVGSLELNINYEFGTLNGKTGDETYDSKNRFIRSEFISGGLNIDCDFDTSKYVGYVYRYTLDNVFITRENIKSTNSIFVDENECVRILLKFASDESLTEETMKELSKTVSIFNGQFKLQKSDNNLTESDCVNSWWCNPRTHYDTVRNKLYVSGITRSGMTKIDEFDLTNSKVKSFPLGVVNKDDHNTPSFLLTDDKPPIVAWGDHAVKQYVSVKIGTAPYELDTLGQEIQVNFATDETTEKCSYASFIRLGQTNTIALITRRGSNLWACISKDWGKTWGTPFMFIKKYYYATFKIADGYAKYVCCSHPTESGARRIFYFKINLLNGDISGINNTVFTNLFSDDFTTLNPDTNSNITTIIRTDGSDGIGARVFDIGKSGSILAMNLVMNTPQNGGTYGVYRRQSDGTYIFKEICASGVPIGYVQSSYVGGAVFGSRDDEVYLCRENNGYWYLEKWVYSTSKSEWIKKAIYKKSELKMGRPQFPWGNTCGALTYIEYTHYADDDYTDYYGSQKIMLIS